MLIIPTPLVATFSEFERQIKKIDPLFDYIQIDVMDGKFVDTVSFQEVDRVAEVVTKLRYELHLMVEDPIAEMEKWQYVKNVFRVIFHAESHVDPQEAINYARSKHWQVGVALNPDTPLEKIKTYLPLLNVVMFMTVYPGRQGAAFQPQVLEKIKTYNTFADRPICAVDGGVNKNTIVDLKNAGVDIANVGSALMKAENIKAAYQELEALVN